MGQASGPLRPSLGTAPHPSRCGYSAVRQTGFGVSRPALGFVTEAMMAGGHSPLGHPPCIHPRAPAPSASPGNSSATRNTKPHPGPPESRPLGVGLSSETLDELFGGFPSGLEVRKLHLGPPSRPPPCTRRCSDRHHGPGPRRDTRPRSLMTLTALALRTSLLGTHGAGRCQRPQRHSETGGDGQCRLLGLGCFASVRRAPGTRHSWAALGRGADFLLS